MMSVIYGQPITLGGGSSEPELLWTNASPASNFAAQTISLNGSGYAGYLVEIAIGTNSAICFVPFFTGGTTYSGCNVAMLHTDGRGNYYNSGRFVANATASGIQFSDVYYNGKVSTNNNYYAIPTRIWGVKFTL